MEGGQIIPLFAFCLVAMLAVAALLMDGGLAWANRRQAQSAADAAALAAAQAVNDGTDAATAASDIAGRNGYASDLTDCAGNQLANQGVQTFNPPQDGAHAGDPHYVEVITTRAMRTAFAGAIGMSCWLVSAMAVAEVPQSTFASKCTFCSLNSSSANHTLVLNNSSQLVVDGDIYVNSSNANWSKYQSYFVYGDGFDIFGAGGSLTAHRISVVGGWETHNANTAKALAPSPGCSHPNVPAQAGVNSFVCIGMLPLNDPLISIPPPSPGPVPGLGVSGCGGATVFPSPAATAANPIRTNVFSANAVLCPGTYYGGISISGGVTVRMLAGVYYMASGGFQVTGSAKVDGSAGVMIYNSTAVQAQSDITYGDLVPDPDPNLASPTAVLTSSAPNGTVAVNQAAKLTLTLTGNAAYGWPQGTVDFYDGSIGNDVCPAAAVTQIGSSLQGSAACNMSWPTDGTHVIIAVYHPSGSLSSFYNIVGDVYSQVVGQAGYGASAGSVSIATSGWANLAGPTSGQYKGMTIFQWSGSSATINVSPLSSVPGVGSCPSGFMSGAAGARCGPLGGITGTIYAPNDNATVIVTTSGLADLQVIAGKIAINNGALARFAWTPNLFANSGVRLVQ